MPRRTREEDDEKAEIPFTFIDMEGDDDDEPQDGYTFKPDHAFRGILHDGSEAFGYESGAAVFGTKNDKSLGSDDFIHPDLTAAEVAKKYGTVILIHPREDETPTGSYHTYLGDPPESDEDDDDEDDDEDDGDGAAGAGSLRGKTICFTGTLKMKRADAEKKAKAAGATVAGSITNAVETLVTGDKCGAKKLEDARKKGVKEFLTEAEFNARL